LVRRRRVDDAPRGEVDGAGIALVLILAPPVDGIVDAVIAEDADELFDVRQMRHVLECQRIVRQQRGDHPRQRGVLGAGDWYRAVEFGASANAYAVHGVPFPGRISPGVRCSRVVCPRASPPPVQENATSRADGAWKATGCEPPLSSRLPRLSAHASRAFLCWWREYLPPARRPRRRGANGPAPCGARDWP